MVQAGGVELGQSLAGFFKGIVADGGVFRFLATPCKVLPQLP